MARTHAPPSPTPAAPPAVRRGGPISRGVYRLLAICHRWAESGWGGPAVGGWGLLQGSVMPGPTDIVLIPLGIADPGRVFRLALWATAGATLGGLLAYLIGALAFEQLGRPLLQLLGVTERLLESSHARFERQGWMLVLLSTVSPLSSKVVCLAAGAFGVPVWEFAPALLAGRLARFGAIAVLLRFASPKLLDTLSRRAGVRPATTRVLPLDEAPPPR